MDKTEYRYISYRYTNKSTSKYYNYRTNEFYYDTVRKMYVNFGEMIERLDNCIDEIDKYLNYMR